MTESSGPDRPADFLGDILRGQNVLHMNPANVAIQSDGKDRKSFVNCSAWCIYDLISIYSGWLERFTC